MVDGDTLVIGNERIRLYGVDAPESKQICKCAGAAPPFALVLTPDPLRRMLSRRQERPAALCVRNRRPLSVSAQAARRRLGLRQGRRRGTPEGARPRRREQRQVHSRERGHVWEVCADRTTAAHGKRGPRPAPPLPDSNMSGARRHYPPQGGGQVPGCERGGDQRVSAQGAPESAALRASSASLSRLTRRGAGGWSPTGGRSPTGSTRRSSCLWRRRLGRRG